MAARSTVVDIGGQVGLAAIGRVAIAVGKAGIAGSPTDTVGTGRNTIGEGRTDVAARSTVVDIALFVDTHATATMLAGRAVAGDPARTGTVDTRFPARADMTAGATVVGIGGQVRLAAIGQVAIAVAKAGSAANAACAS